MGVWCGYVCVRACACSPSRLRSLDTDRTKPGAPLALVAGVGGESLLPIIGTRGGSRDARKNRLRELLWLPVFLLSVPAQGVGIPTIVLESFCSSPLVLASSARVQHTRPFRPPAFASSGHQCQSWPARGFWRTRGIMHSCSASRYFLTSLKPAFHMLIAASFTTAMATPPAGRRRRAMWARIHR